MKKQIAQNSFQGGMNSDVSYFFLQKNMYTFASAVELRSNGGDEMMCQSIKGTEKVLHNEKEVKLSPGFYPLAFKVFNEVAYILSWNPKTAEGEIGHFPSFEPVLPFERTFTGTNALQAITAQEGTFLIEVTKTVDADLTVDIKLNKTNTEDYRLSTMKSFVSFDFEAKENLNVIVSTNIPCTITIRKITGNLRLVEKYSPFYNYSDTQSVNEALGLNFYGDDTKDVWYGLSTSIGKYVPKNINSLGIFRTAEFKFDPEYPIKVEIQQSFDGSVNVITADGLNPDRIINSGFRVLQDGSVTTSYREGNSSNVYNKDSFKDELNLILGYNQVPNLRFNGILNTGNLLSGVYRYYFFYRTDDRNISTLLEESSTVVVYEGTRPTNIRMTDRRVNKSVSFTLSNLQNNYAFIRVAFVQERGYNASETEYYFLDVDFPVINGSCQITHTGFEPTLQIQDPSVLMVEYTAATTSKTICLLQNRLFRANLKEYTFNLEAFKKYAQTIIADEATSELESFIHHQDSFVFRDDPIGQNAGGFGAYYNPGNIYYRMGYFPGETYALGVVGITKYGTKTPVMPIKAHIYNDVYGYDGVLQTYTNEKELNNEGLMTFSLREIDGNASTKAIKEDKLQVRHLKITIPVPPASVKEEIVGLFFVRSKRKENLLGQGLAVPSMYFPYIQKQNPEQSQDNGSVEPGINNMFEFASYPAIHGGTYITIDKQLPGTPFEFGQSSTSHAYQADTFIRSSFRNSPNLAIYSPDVTGNPNFEVTNFNARNTSLLVLQEILTKIQLAIGTDNVRRASTIITLSKYETGFGITIPGRTNYVLDATKITNIDRFSSQIISDQRNGTNYITLKARAPLGNYIDLKLEVNFSRYLSFIPNKTTISITIPPGGGGEIGDECEPLFLSPGTPPTEACPPPRIPRQKDNGSGQLVWFCCPAEGSPGSPAVEIPSPALAYLNIYRNRYYKTGNSYYSLPTLEHASGFLVNIYPLGGKWDKNTIKTVYQNALNEPYYQITNHYSWEQLNVNRPNDEVVTINAYRGDAYVNPILIKQQFHLPGDEFRKEEDIAERAIVLCFFAYSKTNTLLRSTEEFSTVESALTGLERGFVPYTQNRSNSLSFFAEKESKTPESSNYVNALSDPTTIKPYFGEGNAPFINRIFENRVDFSNLYVNENFENGIRIFRGLNFIDYNIENGPINDITAYQNNLLLVQSYALSLAGVNEKSMVADQMSGNVFVNQVGILNPYAQPISDFGSLYFVNNNVQGIFGYDSYKNRVWNIAAQSSAFSKSGAKAMSDFNVRNLLNPYVNELRSKPINVITNYPHFYYDDVRDSVIFNLKTSRSLPFNNVADGYILEYMQLVKIENGVIKTEKKPNDPADPDYVPPVKVYSKHIPTPKTVPLIGVSWIGDKTSVIFTPEYKTKQIFAHNNFNILEDFDSKNYYTYLDYLTLTFFNGIWISTQPFNPAILFNSKFRTFAVPAKNTHDLIGTALGPNKELNFYKHHVTEKVQFYERDENCILSFVVVDNPDYQKIFENIKIISNNIIPDKMQYENDNDYIYRQPPTVTNSGIKVPYEQQLVDIGKQGIYKGNAIYKENHVYIQVPLITDPRLPEAGDLRLTTTRIKNGVRVYEKKIRDKYCRITIIYPKGMSKRLLLTSLLTTYNLSHA